MEQQSTKGICEEALLETLESLSTNTTTIFDAAIQQVKNMNKHYFQVARHVLSWLVAAARPLKVDEVRHAFAINWADSTFDRRYTLRDDEITRSCAGIVVIGAEILQPVHESVLEHIRCSSVIFDNPHAEVALQCLTYLSQPGFTKLFITKDDYRNFVRDHPLARYTTKYWFEHVARSKPNNQVESRTLRFLKNSAALLFSFYLQDPDLPQGINGLHACAYFDMESWARRLIEDKVDINHQDGNGRTGLHWAVTYNHQWLVELLIQQDAQLDIEDRAGNTAFHLAVRQNREALVRCLIKSTARRDIRNKQGFTPLRWAIEHGPSSIVFVLVKSRVEVDVEDSDGYTPLKWAIFQ